MTVDKGARPGDLNPHEGKAQRFPPTRQRNCAASPEDRAVAPVRMDLIEIEVLDQSQRASLGTSNQAMSRQPSEPTIS